eukprot:6177369-Pleurochrysis_carterae.AAC.2
MHAMRTDARLAGCNLPARASRSRRCSGRFAAGLRSDSRATWRGLCREPRAANFVLVAALVKDVVARRHALFCTKRPPAHTYLPPCIADSMMRDCLSSVDDMSARCSWSCVC